MATVSELLAANSTMTITLASLANSTAGVGRQSTLVDNTANLYLSAQISVSITVGTTPTANSLIYVYLIRQDNNTTPIADDGAGTTDAGITITNAPLLGTLLVPATTSNVAYKRIFDTTVLGTLSPKWGIAVVNSSGVALNATAGNHVVTFIGYKATVA